MIEESRGDSPDRRARCRGALLGMAIGDVLGAPVEGMLPETIRRRFGRVTEVLRLPAREVPDIHRFRLPGLHTDDTQQALAIADVLIEHGEIVGDHLLTLWTTMATATILPDATGRARRLRRAYCGCHRGTGGGFRRRLKHPQEPPPESPGIGPAMRVAPIAVFFADRDTRILNTVRSAQASNGDWTATAAAVAIAAAVAAAAHNDPFAAIRDELCRAQALVPAAAGAFAAYHKLLGQLQPTWRADTLDELLDEHTRCLREHLRRPEVYATKGLAATAATTAIAIALRYRNDYERAIVETVNLGGDSDTVAAMVGAIVGARFGEHAIPVRWRRQLAAGVETAVRQRADGLADSQRPSGWQPLVDLETAWTGMEAERRVALAQQARYDEQKLFHLELSADIADELTACCAQGRPGAERILLTDSGRMLAELYWTPCIERDWYDVCNPPIRYGSERLVGTGSGKGRHFLSFRIGHAHDRRLLAERLQAHEGDEIARVELGELTSDAAREDTIYTEDEALLPRFGASLGFVNRPAGESVCPATVPRAGAPYAELRRRGDDEWRRRLAALHRDLEVLAAGEFSQQSAPPHDCLLRRLCRSAEAHGYGLYDHAGDTPAVVLLGDVHPGGGRSRFYEQLTGFLRCVLAPDDRLITEGNDNCRLLGGVLGPDSIFTALMRLRSERGFQLGFADSRLLLAAQKRYDDAVGALNDRAPGLIAERNAGGAEQTYEQALTANRRWGVAGLQIMQQRDIDHAFLDFFGLREAVQKGVRAYFVIGAAHVMAGDLDAVMRVEDIPFAAFLPNHGW